MSTQSNFTLDSNEDILDIDKKAEKRTKFSSEQMEKAGSFVYEEVVQYFTPCNIIILCGPGDNGAQGIVLARMLSESNWNVVLAMHHANNKYSKFSLKSLKSWKGKIVELSTIDLKNHDLIIDAIFGSGLNRAVSGIYLQTIYKVNQSHLPIVSIDVPSGIHSLNCEIMGAAIKADMTVTIAPVKPVHNSNFSLSNMGKIIVKNS